MVIRLNKICLMHETTFSAQRISRLVYYCTWLAAYQLCFMRPAAWVRTGRAKAPALSRLLRWLAGRGLGLAAPASPAAAAHLLAKLFAGFGTEVFEAAGHALLPLAALAGPGPGPPTAPEPAKKNAAQQQQAKGLAERDGGQTEKRGHQPVPQVLGEQAGGSDKQRREKAKAEAAQQPEFTVHEGVG